MELQWGHVQVNVETVTICGRPVPPVQLQWGHVQVNVETSPVAGYLFDDGQLQWGHVQVNVETTVRVPLLILCLASTSFNGATFR